MLNWILENWIVCLIITLSLFLLAVHTYLDVVAYCNRPQRMKRQRKHKRIRNVRGMRP